MSPFQSGSAWAMTRDIAHGHLLVTDRTLRRLNSGEVDKLAFEVDRYTRELRGELPPAEDTIRLRERNQKILRLARVSRMIQLRRMERA
jgi:hypothetical protein